MRMSDVMSSLGLAVYPTVAMLLFLSVFAGVVRRVMSRSRRQELDDAALLPLGDDADRSCIEGPRSTGRTVPRSGWDAAPRDQHMKWERQP